MPDRTLATILAALRFWQYAQTRPSPARFNRTKAMMEIATDGGHFENLSSKEIDELCEHLNRDETAIVQTEETAEEKELNGKYRAAAEGLTSSNNQEIQIDADATVSTGMDPGAYVAAWVWVTNEEAGIEDKSEGVQ